MISSRVKERGGIDLETGTEVEAAEIGEIEEIGIAGDGQVIGTGGGGVGHMTGIGGTATERGADHEVVREADHETEGGDISKKPQYLGTWGHRWG